MVEVEESHSWGIQKRREDYCFFFFSCWWPTIRIFFSSCIFCYLGGGGGNVWFGRAYGSAPATVQGWLASRSWVLIHPPLLFYYICFVLKFHALVCNVFLSHPWGYTMIMHDGYIKVGIFLWFLIFIFFSLYARFYCVVFLSEFEKIHAFI